MSRVETIIFLRETAIKLAPNASEEQIEEFVEGMLKRITFIHQ